MFRKTHQLKSFGSIRKRDYTTKSSSARKVHVTRVSLHSRNHSLGNHVTMLTIYIHNSNQFLYLNRCHLMKLIVSIEIILIYLMFNLLINHQHM